MYPSLEHLVDPKNHAEVAVGASIINDMKPHLGEVEFWKVIGHLFVVGVNKKITPSFCKRLPKGRNPARHYTKQQPNQAVQATADVPRT